MPFDQPQPQDMAADYNVTFYYAGNPDPNYTQQLSMNMKTRVGDLMPTAVQREAIQAFIDLINESDNFEFSIASATYFTSEVITPTNPAPTE